MYILHSQLTELGMPNLRVCLLRSVGASQPCEHPLGQHWLGFFLGFPETRGRREF